MMRALVVYESMYGNTKAIAEAVAAGLASQLSVELVEVGEAPTVIGADVALLVVGAPTHGLTLSKPESRKSAAERTDQPLVSGRIGLREWLATLTGPAGLAAAAFDTRVNRPRLPGSAAHRAGRQLRRLGFRMVARPESFWVNWKPGRLRDGEPNRARRWGGQLAAGRVSV